MVSSSRHSLAGNDAIAIYVTVDLGACNGAVEWLVAEKRLIGDLRMAEGGAGVVDATKSSTR